MDAYGVLNDRESALPGARELVAALDAARQPFLVVTNDSSRLPTTLAARFASLGLSIPAERILTSGSLLARHFADENLTGAKTVVLGTPDSHAYARAAGAELVSWDEHALDPEVVVIGDDEGFPFLPATEAVVTAIMRRFAAGKQVTLLLPNPDLIYPKGGDAYGFTSGAVALLMEAALARRFPGHPGARFVGLGKPFPPLFLAAIEKLGTRDLVMIGDQLETDICGARGVGLDAALIGTGVARAQIAPTDPASAPTYWLPSLLD